MNPETRVIKDLVDELEASHASINSDIGEVARARVADVLTANQLERAEDHARAEFWKYRVLDEAGGRRTGDGLTTWVPTVYESPDGGVKFVLPRVHYLAASAEHHEAYGKAVVRHAKLSEAIGKAHLKFARKIRRQRRVIPSVAMAAGSA
jgi:hypothetical protein